MVCITIRFLFMVISNNELYLVHFFLFDGKQTKVSFFEDSAWSMTKALCLNAIAPEASYSFFWLLNLYHDFPKNVSEISGQYFYDQIFCIKR